jgi:glycosyltransferase involved in cell wall biosynthesis
MTALTCAISESRIKPRDEPPLLTLFVPTWNRTVEMVQTIENLAAQLTGGLERKVEILISDNCSGAEGQEAVRSLAERFDTVSYMINAADQGGHFQVYAAPWRARGVWTWVFGSDDLLEPGAVADVVALLEAEDPSFLTMDKSIWSRDFSQCLYEATNGIPDRAFPNFIDLFKGVGLHQVAFLSASLEKTEAGRRIDPYRYMCVDTLHNYMIAYFEKHRDRKCVYTAKAHVRRRLDNSVIADYLGVTFEDVGLKLPLILLNLTREFGVGDDIFEQVNGSRFIDTYDAPAITMVDNIFEYMLRSVSKGRPIAFFQRLAFEKLCESWRPHRREQFDNIWSVSEKLRRSTEEMEQARRTYEEMMRTLSAERDAVHAESFKFTDRKIS